VETWLCSWPSFYVAFALAVAALALALGVVALLTSLDKFDTSRGLLT